MKTTRSPSLKRTGPRRRPPDIRVSLDPRRASQLSQMATDLEVDVAVLVRVWIADRLDHAHPGWSAGPVSPPVVPPRRTRSGARIRDGKTHRRGGLHAEVVAALKEKGEPMSVAEIAEAIRQRGQYLAPRTQRPVTAVSVSQRIAHPRYRRLFRREGRRVGLPAGAE